jgi:hypothetical protein
LSEIKVLESRSLPTPLNGWRMKGKERELGKGGGAEHVDKWKSKERRDG